MNAENWVLLGANCIFFVMWQIAERGVQDLRRKLACMARDREALADDLTRLERMMRSAGALPKGWDEGSEEGEYEAERVQKA